MAELVFRHAPDDLLRNQVRDRATYLAGEENADRLIDLLFRLFSEAATGRRHYETTQLLELIQRASIVLIPPPGRTFAEVPPMAQKALIVLAASPVGLPIPALAFSLQLDEGHLMGELQPLVAQKLVMHDGETLRFVGWPPAHPEEHSGLVAPCLDLLLSWLLDHETSELAETVAASAVSIARIAVSARPGLALKLFQATEHVIKNVGDKHLLMQVSELCIHAGNNASPLDRDLKAKAKAQAMLCGHSWVYQRTGRLSEARVWAEKSEQLGEDVGWDRNTAFARKCLGRLDRVESEQTATPEERARLLAESERKLREAIRLFSQSLEFGPTHRQVGDCYSLLGRTQLVAGNVRGAAESIRKAYDLLLPAATKEYFDLLILTGDIESAHDNTDAAESSYTQVIETHRGADRELSEICARAYLSRGRLRVAHNRKKAGVDDLDRATEIWRSLGEHELASQARWVSMDAYPPINRPIFDLFSHVRPYAVRNATLDGYIERVKGTKAIARRAIPTNAQIEQLVQAARKSVAEEHPEW